MVVVAVQGAPKVPTLRRWLVVVSGPELINDVRKASDDVLSAIVPISDVRFMSQYNFEASYSQGIS